MSHYILKYKQKHIQKTTLYTVQHYIQTGRWTVQVKMQKTNGTQFNMTVIQSYEECLRKTCHD